MKSVFRTKGIKERIMDDLVELNGFHEVTDKEFNNVTQPEWKEIVTRQFPNMDLQNKKVDVDLETEIITIE